MTEELSRPDTSWNSARRLLGHSPLSVIMPAHNLADVISGNIRRVHDLLEGQIPFEIVVVDDGSTDETRARISDSRQEFDSVKLVALDENVGKGAAIKAGFAASTGPLVLFLDADLDIPPEQLTRFFDEMESSSAAAVLASKRHPQSDVEYPWHRRVVSTVYYAITKILVGLPVKDTQTGLKLFKREALEWAFPRALVKRFAFDLELLAIINEHGFKIAEAPVTIRFQSRLGCVRPTTVRQVMTDTLAIFYRLRLLRYYQTLQQTCMPSPSPFVSIVIAYPAPTAQLQECLASLDKQAYDEFEIILLPDEPSGSEYPKNAREISTGHLRPAEKRNIGIEAARGDIVAFLDDDVFADKEWLYHALLHFADPDVAAVGGPSSTPGSDSYMSRLSGRVYANPLVSGGYRYRYVPEHVREVDDFPTCNLLVRTNALRELGGFSTSFWPGEDTYLCLEIVTRLNRKIMYDPRAHVYHHRRPLFMPHLRQIGRYALHRGYFARHYPATSRRISYMLPSLFVLGVVFGGISCTVIHALIIPYLSVLSIYAVITLLSCFNRNPVTWLLTWTGVLLTHIVYGSRFLAGILGLGLPRDVKPFDHPSEGEGDTS